MQNFRVTVGFFRCSWSFPKSSVAPRAFRSERLSSNREFRGTTCATKPIVSTPRSHSSSTVPWYSWCCGQNPEPHWTYFRDPTRLFSTGFHVALECISSDQRFRTARVWHCAAWAVTDSHDLCVCLVSTVCFLLLRYETFPFLFSHQFFQTDSRAERTSAVAAHSISQKTVHALALPVDTWTRFLRAVSTRVTKVPTVVTPSVAGQFRKIWHLSDPCGPRAGQMLVHMYFQLSVELLPCLGRPSLLPGATSFDRVAFFVSKRTRDDLHFGFLLRFVSRIKVLLGLILQRPVYPR